MSEQKKCRMILTVESDSYQGLLDFMNAVKNWKRFKYIHYVDHRLSFNKKAEVAGLDDDEQMYGKGGGFTPQ